MEKILLYNSNRTPLALSNICFMGNCTAEQLRSSLLETKTSDDFIKTVRKLTKLNFKLVKSTDYMIQLSYEDHLGNIDYLVGIREQSNISQEKIDAAKSILCDYGVDMIYTEQVLNTICLILFGKSIHN